MTTEELPSDGLPDSDAYEAFRHAKIKEAMAVLREHFDSVIVLAETLEQIEDSDGDLIDCSRYWRNHIGSTYACQELCRQYISEMKGQYERQGAATYDSIDDDE